MISLELCLYALPVLRCAGLVAEKLTTHVVVNASNVQILLGKEPRRLGSYEPPEPVIIATAIAYPSCSECVLHYLAMLSAANGDIAKYIGDRDVVSIHDVEDDVYSANRACPCKLHQFYRLVSGPLQLSALFHFGGKCHAITK